ncbi:zinc finger CCCH-type containing 7Ba isoform X2 [Tachysurus fulvidraco]|uniref:zinc finger CCCH-type containing 7Ba isoform X2 n=1 Tax=Tachysurus fulvidraco TaxID=1234273 RepID=UPI001FEF4A9F|nr:zinc finger CCCH-type containing 7Ba isoform X2 [Tachysurus fulvidraco]
MNQDRQKRKEEIQKALAFIQSSLPYPDPDGYEGFLVQLVCNLLDEGNAAFREGDWTLARGHFGEGVSVARYAQAEGLTVPAALLESLYVNRAAAQHNMGELEASVRDCDSALSVCKDSGRALYRKAVCLKTLGRINEAYECSTACLNTCPQDERVKDLAQDLADTLDQQTCKGYTGVQQGVTETNIQNLPSMEVSNGLDALCDVSDTSPVLPAPVPVSDTSEEPALCLSVPVSEQLGDSELVGDELDTLLDCVSKEEQLPQTLCKGSVVPTHVPVMSLRPPFSPLLPAPSPCLPPAFFPSAVTHLNTLDLFCEASRDPSLLVRPLDSLDSFSQALPQGSLPHRLPLVVGGEGLDSLSEFTLPGGKVSHSFLPPVKISSSSNCVNALYVNGHVTSTLSQLSKNPLEHTHDFTQACSACFIRTGTGVLDCEFRSDLSHSCKKDTLLCRRKGGVNLPWRRVRPRPARSNFQGPYVLCKEVLERQDCKYGEACTFAYCQEEIDVWTQERQGLLTRELLFNPLSSNQRQALSVIRLLTIHGGMFMFLCEGCFDSRPRTISKRCKENPSLCSSVVSHHQFDRNKCLVHVVKNSSSVCYSKIRPLSTHRQFDVCRHEVRYGCQRDKNCSFAHSLIELECWILQKDHGTTHEEIVQESKKHWHKHRQVNISQTNGTVSRWEGQNKWAEWNGKAGLDRAAGAGNVSGVKGHDLRLAMKFVCSQCWSVGLQSEPDRTLKYCSAKARHSWIKERRVLLVKSLDREKWVAVRPLPFAKTFPQQYDICVHVLKEKKCNYIGNCSFAHSLEEKELWTYMKNTGSRDLQQVYDTWSMKANQMKRLEGAMASPFGEEKQITMPTDFAEAADGFHCRLCGKHSNGERQWQQHISSEKHKERVLSGAGEEESLTWTHRFPGPYFSLCPRLEGGCDDGVSCDYAHSDDELREWHERRDFLRRRLERARADMLIAPNDHDFGKYNFLLLD